METIEKRSLSEDFDKELDKYHEIRQGYIKKKFKAELLGGLFFFASGFAGLAFDGYRLISHIASSPNSTKTTVQYLHLEDNLKKLEIGKNNLVSDSSLHSRIGNIEREFDKEINSLRADMQKLGEYPEIKNYTKWRAEYTYSSENSFKNTARGFGFGLFGFLIGAGMRSKVRKKTNKELATFEYASLRTPIE